MVDPAPRVEGVAAPAPPAPAQTTHNTIIDTVRQLTDFVSVPPDLPQADNLEIPVPVEILRFLETARWNARNNAAAQQQTAKLLSRIKELNEENSQCRAELEFAPVVAELMSDEVQRIDMSDLRTMKQVFETIQDLGGIEKVKKMHAKIEQVNRKKGEMGVSDEDVVVSSLARKP